MQQHTPPLYLRNVDFDMITVGTLDKRVFISGLNGSRDTSPLNAGNIYDLIPLINHIASQGPRRVGIMEKCTYDGRIYFLHFYLINGHPVMSIINKAAAKRRRTTH